MLRWQPDPTTLQKANLTHYFDWLRQHPDYLLDFQDYHSAWQWSAAQPERFWASLVQYFDLHWTYTEVMQGDMPHTRWFEGATLNYAEEIFRRGNRAAPAILFKGENQALREVSWAEIEQKTAALAAHLRQLGVKPGDCVAAFLPNIPEATIALLAVLSIGAVWSSTSPDFGAGSVLERFEQIQPKVLIAVDGYRYGGKTFDRCDVVRSMQDRLSSLAQTVLIPYIGLGTNALSAFVSWENATSDASAVLSFEAVPFAHPMWVLYSSGTTGLPKAITHSHGGMLLEHLKYLTFHNDVQRGERFFWFTTTGWMMWNFLNAALLTGATIVQYDGSPAFPDLNALWDLARETEIVHFGTSAAYLLACQKADISLMAKPLPHLRSIGSTGSPLPPEGFAWVYEHVKSDVWLSSMSGGTDVCTAWVGGCPLLPVYEGEIQCRCLGTAMEAYDEQGAALQDAVGEMVVTKPMPCMPVFFWNDADFAKYKGAYFEDYPGVWRHGDWLRITPRGGLVILGRSDATLNRQGIRIGTSEIYRSVEKLPEIKDSLIVNLEYDNGDSFMPLFVVLAENATLDAALKQKIARQLRTDFSPRHVPDDVFAVAEIPYTISGKKMELPVKKILMGKSIEKSVNPDAMRNPGALEVFKELFLTKM